MAEDYHEMINLKMVFKMFFSIKPYVIGFEIYIVSQTEDNNGMLHLTIIDSISGKAFLVAA